MRTFALVLLVASLSTDVAAQKQERQLLLYNVAFGGVTASIGAVINKPPNTGWGRTLVRAFGQGSLGGSVNFAAKKTLYLVNRHEAVAYALPARLLHSAGNSIIENAAFGRPFLQSWNLDFGPVRIDFVGGSARRFKTRFLPQTLYAVPYAWRDARLDVPTSLLSGVLSFRSKAGFVTGPDGQRYDGFCFGRAITYAPISNQYEVIAHELVHSFQFREYQVLNTWVAPLGNQLPNGLLKTTFRQYVYFDAPYQYPFYLLAGRRPFPDYYRNFYEFEAQRFATNQPVER
jgi:hypothetical protein